MAALQASWPMRFMSAFGQFGIGIWDQARRPWLPLYCHRRQIKFMKLVWFRPLLESVVVCSLWDSLSKRFRNLKFQSYRFFQLRSFSEFFAPQRVSFWLQYKYARLSSWKQRQKTPFVDIFWLKFQYNYYYFTLLVFDYQWLIIYFVKNIDVEILAYFLEFFR